ncbi:BLUF domain-containing protein [Shewanella youngdeokensis]|uniref:BLUF domain-containing protein n=1 Tax=Shewanella youngdeokensis TaxID=2999068 RepID=A0ABZ0K2V8_9GAMM|nr:BLUF domain-containing protein [Shewanella sp. DAU334]
MFELLYTSVSPKGLSDSDLKDILEKARAKNLQFGVTGMMVYHDREIMQILEGDKKEVQALFQTIFEDDRHTSVEVFYQGDIKNRAFSEWSMAFKALDKNMIQTITEGYEGFDKNISPISMMKDSPNRGKKTFISLRDIF